ncbi:acyltransferase family protein [Clavibacter sp. km1a]|uniref:acyltransferase family protein n=1 Tax=Clavibacter sp. km1a TaxID=3459136 RepID=UPI004043729C
MTATTGIRVDAPHRRVAGLDLIRGVAIALVLLRHAWPDAFGSGGIVGVVIFFTLSGYLITGILSRDVERAGRVRYMRFYRNRAIRLLPPLVTMLAVLGIVTLTLDPLGERGGLTRALIVGLTYTGNFPFDLGSSAIDHLWTLATEEQFYLVWPLLLTLGIRKGRLRAVLLAAGLALGLVLCTTLVLTYPDVHRIYRLPTSWALAMVLGAAARISTGSWKAWFAARASRRRVAGTAAAAALLLLTVIPDGKDSIGSYLVLGPLVAVLTVVLITSWRAWDALPTQWLRPLLALGTVSYAAYLWNYPLLLWLGTAVDARWLPIASIATTLLAAIISWWFVEVPSQRLRQRYDRRDRLRAQEEMTTGPA